MLLGLLSEEFSEEGAINIEGRSAKRARMGGFSFSEMAAKEAIKAVGGTNKGASEFISALRKVGLMQ